MQKVFIVSLAVFLFSCKAEERKDAETKGESTVAKSGALSLYPASYSSSFEMGNAANVETMMNVWKAWDNGDLKSARKYFADSMRFYTREGNKSEGPTDSTLAGGQMYRDMFTTVKSTVHSIFPVKSTDKNDNWVCIWGTEVSTDKQGKTDSVGLQEMWRFNKDGKIDLMYQYGKVLAAPATPAR